MTTVSVREFAFNPSAMFARVERGETIEVTKHGKVIAVLSPPARPENRYRDLVARGLLRPAARAPGEDFAHIEVPDDADALQILLDVREDER